MSGRRIVLFSTGDRFEAIEQIEASFTRHLKSMGEVETVRLGVVDSLLDAYHASAKSIGDPEALLLFVHQDARPMHMDPDAPVPVPAFPPQFEFLHKAFSDPYAWVRAVENLLSKQDTGFLGVAGSLGLTLETAAWWNNPELTGGVIHTTADGRGSLNPYGPWGRALVLDGMLLMAPRRTFQKIEPPATNSKEFHFYDLELTLAAHNAGLKNWTIPLMMVHESGGAKVTDPEWLRGLNSFLERHQKEMPVSLPREPLPEVL